MPEPDRSEAAPADLDEPTRRLIRALFRHAPTPDWSIQRHRETFERAAQTRPLASGVATVPVEIEGLPAEWSVPAAPPPATPAARPAVAAGPAADLPTGPPVAGTRVVLYLHGGGFVMGSVATTRPLATQLAAATGYPVLYPAYRLAPEHPHPAALDDAYASYRWLLRQGFPASRIAVAGDSAGCALAVGLMLRLRDESLPLPAAGVCLSPFLDLALRSPSIVDNARFDPQAPRWLLAQMVHAYLGTADPSDPRHCGFYADLAGLPPLLIQSGELESVRDDGVRFATRARAAGVDVTLRVWPAGIHVWHAFAPRLPAANQALSEVGRWLRSRQWG